MMTSAEIRESFLTFFKERGHTIVPSAPVVPFDDPTLLFANAGMNQFKDVFLGQGKRSYSRAADTQKCIRVSGKHNDLEEVGRDTYHHTFFEMLGNWSFGDYYKEEAIRWAWELLTVVWGLPKDRLWATVYENDDEADQLWKTVTDINPGHILRFGEKDNFWEMGETGPCGPCSEIHIDRTPDGTATPAMVNAGVPEVMEIWNLVFIQYNRDSEGTLHPLPAKHVDTGMGFERICAVLQEKQSNYDSDVFTPVIRKLSELSGIAYDGRLSSVTKTQLETDTAMRVVADHLRALTFAIADSAIPSNEGRGYVLRRLLRRAARFGRNLGFREPFLFKLVPTLVETMGPVFPEISEKQAHVQKTIRGEEESFNATLDRGLEIFEFTAGQIGNSKAFPGAEAFKLYDTFGFPLDLTQLLAAERSLQVDIDEFNRLMEEQRHRSRVAEIGPTEAAEGTLGIDLIRTRESARTLSTDELEGRFTFIGYDHLDSDGVVLAARGNLLVLDQTPFYGEAGGQVGDQGEIALGGSTFKVLDTQKSGNVNVHILQDLPEVGAGSSVRTKVDAVRRQSVMRNHTATHLLHAALRKVLGTHVHQAGSLVSPDHLRFDFTHSAKVSHEELKAIEELVNEKIHGNISLNHHRNIPFDEAKKMGALMFFGDKYGDRVNVVEFSDFTREFCGGTHVHTTADIGYFKFRSEGSVASGVRRVEAVTSDAALNLLEIQGRSTEERLRHAEEQLHLLNSAVQDGGSTQISLSPEIVNSLSPLEARIATLRRSPALPQRSGAELRMGFELLAQREKLVEELILEIAEKQRTLDRELARVRLHSQTGLLDTLVTNAGITDGFKIVSAQVYVQSMDELKSLGDALRAKIGTGVGLLAAVTDEKVSLVCVVTDDLIATKKLEAGKIVGAIAKLLGGGGGGKAHLATAGGKDVSQLAHALSSTSSVVESLLKNTGSRR